METECMKIVPARTEREIRACYPVFSELRPHLSEEDFVGQVGRQMNNHGYEIACVMEGGRTVAAAGYRVAEFLAWGRILYVDDLVTATAERRRGYAGTLLDWLLREAEKRGCSQLHLDSGSQRHDAHRLYMSRKLRINGYHFSVEIG